MDKKLEMGCKSISENIIQCDIKEDNKNIGSILFSSKNGKFKIEMEGEELVKRVKR